MSALLPFAHAWLWLGLAVSTSLASQPGITAPRSEATTLRGTYGNHGLWLSLGEADGADAALAIQQQDAAISALRNEPRIEKADYVVLDIRGGGEVSMALSRSVATQLWGSQPVASSVALSDASLATRRLKPGARVFVLGDGHCAAACQLAVDVWKRNGAVELEIPRAVLAQDELAVEAWVLAATDAPRSSDNVATSTKSKRASAP